MSNLTVAWEVKDICFVNNRTIVFSLQANEVKRSLPFTSKAAKLLTSKKTKNMYGFENVLAWQKAYDFVLLVYRLTRNFPDEERFGLTSQFRRAAVSVEANIAEGYKKLSKADKLRFFNIAQGSLEECRTYHLLARDLNFISTDEYNQLRENLETASKLLNAYCKAIVNNAAIKE